MNALGLDEQYELLKTAVERDSSYWSKLSNKSTATISRRGKWNAFVGAFANIMGSEPQ